MTLHAVIGIGSNSTRMLIGGIDGGAVTPIRRFREGTRLFAGLQNGELSEASMLTTAMVVARFVELARADGIDDIRVIATSAVRDAGNGAAFCEEVKSLCGVAPRILSGEEEARLSFLGSCGTGFCGMIDLGGGSTEIAAGGGNRPLAAASAQLGAVRLMGEVPDLAGEGFGRALALSKARAADVWTSIASPEKPAAWVVVGGTATCLASIDMRLAEYDRDAVEGHPLRRSAVEKWARALSTMTVTERAAVQGIVPQRADIIAHGAVALLGILSALDLPRVVISNRTNLDGTLYEIAGARAANDSVETVRIFYDASVEQEWSRLERHSFEFEINKHYIDRYVKPGDRVLDVGGGPGRYSLHLAARGADVTLVDLSEGNVEFARAKAAEAGLPLGAIAADARALDDAADGEYDAILLMGPLYHLLHEEDRVRVVEACIRRLKPGGVLCAAFISMVAGMIYAARELPESILWEGEDAFYEKMIAREDYAGAAFTQAFFIDPSHVAPFMARFAQLEKLHLLSSEGIAAPFQRSLADATPEARAKWLAVSLALCEREEFFTFAEHFLYIGRKREETT